jgi:hypothetical protein
LAQGQNAAAFAIFAFVIFRLRPFTAGQSVLEYLAHMSAYCHEVGPSPE